MLKIYGSLMCSDCTNCMKNFDHLKEIHDIGFPAIVKEDGTVFTDWGIYLKEQGKEIITRDGAACSIQ